MGGILSSSGSAMAGASAQDVEEIKKGIQDLVNQNKVVIYSKNHCPYCINAKKCFDKLNAKYVLIELNNHPQAPLLQDILMELTGERTVPRVFINGSCIGGGTETVQLFKNGSLQKMLE